jgi:hypothetical protein
MNNALTLIDRARLLQRIASRIRIALSYPTHISDFRLEADCLAEAILDDIRDALDDVPEALNFPVPSAAVAAAATSIPAAVADFEQGVDADLDAAIDAARTAFHERRQAERTT